MPACEVPARLSEEGRLELPDEIVAQLPRERALRLIVLAPEPGDGEDDDAWGRLAAEQFVAGYSEADAIYEKE